VTQRQRLSLNLADALTPCSFAAGETDEAPECSASLVLSAAREQYDREATRGVLDTGRYKLSYRVWGRGPALIFVPGLCDDAEGFVLPISRLRQSYCCIAYDMPTGRGFLMNTAEAGKYVQVGWVSVDQVNG